MIADAIVEKIKKISWEKRVQRPGFFQPKLVHIQAHYQLLKISKNQEVYYTNVIWVNNSLYYDDNQTKSFSQQFSRAFEQDPSWPVKMVEQLDAFGEKMKGFDTFNQYLSLAHEIQKFYTIAVPLTDHCEMILKAKNPGLLEFATPYKILDIQNMEQDLQKLTALKGTPSFQKTLEHHLQTYGWIKTFYNVVKPYTEKDILNQLATHPSEKVETISGAKAKDSILIGLQVGIYLRNRIKELMQQLWFYVDPLAQTFAADLHITTDEFFAMTPKEVIDSIEANQLVVEKEEIKQRQRGFVVGMLDKKEIVISGDVADVQKLFVQTHAAAGDIKGMPACAGIVRGTVKVVLSHKEFDKLQDNEILVTTMTTPEFVVIMKKAGAIVTDEGGLSCHAAITAREMKKPCVIGTKIATQVFKDGDRVEVNANTGLVRKL